MPTTSQYVSTVHTMSDRRVCPKIEKSFDDWARQSEANDRNTTFIDSKKIIIIIDDMGVNKKLSKEVIDLKAPLTLAFLPYADNLPNITEQAKNKGHELIIHMPMEPINSGLDVGSIALLDHMNEQEIQKNLDQAFKSFEGYVGINNHMGSKVTQNQTIMNQVMDNLAKRDLFFVDSITIGSSVAASTAEKYGLRFAERDVFLDHEESDEFVQKALQKLEQISQKRGYAIAIGHPKKNTIKALKSWLPDAQKRGFQIVPVSTVVMN